MINKYLFCNHRVAMSALAQRFTLILLSMLIACAFVVWAGVRFEQQTKLAKINEIEKSRVESGRLQISKDIESTLADLRFIAKLGDMRRYLDSGKAFQKRALTDTLMLMSREVRNYEQIRLLDTRGQEMIRINYNEGKPVAVPQAKLQNKSHRYFFKKSIKLAQDEIYVSPLDLNAEQDIVETPYKPTIRLGMAVFDRAGNKRGVVLINYQGDELLEQFHHVVRTQSTMLLNREGYWFVSPRREDEWGFMLGKMDRTFGHDFPEAWRVISAGERGSIQTDQGIFIYATVHPFRVASSTTAASGYGLSEHLIQQYQWKIVSFVPHDALSAIGFFKQNRVKMLLIVVLLLLALASWVIASVTLNRRLERIKRHESDEKFRKITESAQDAIVMMNPDQCISFWNAAAARIFGYTVDEALGQKCHILFALTDEKLRFKRVLQQFFHTGAGYAIGKVSEFLALRKGGGQFPVEVSLSSLSLGGQWHVIGIFRDIGERKQAEALLLAASGEIEDLYNQAPCGYHSLDQEGLIGRINDTELAWFGYTRQEVLGKIKWQDLLTPASQQIFKENFSRFKQRGFVDNVELEIIRKDGTIFSGLLNATVVYDHNGEYLMSRSTVFDIAVRKKVEAALQQQLLFSEALNKIARSIVAYDEPGLILEDVVKIIGEVLTIDRALIYDISFDKQQVIGMAEWLNPLYPDIMPNKAIYPLSLFASGAAELRQTRRYLISRCGQINPHLLKDGSAEILHHKMGIKSLLWYPFDFRAEGYFLLTLNQIYSDVAWGKEKIDFLDSVSQLVSVALKKISIVNERQQAAEELRIAATAFETDECIMITDKHTNIIRVNRAFTRLTGYSAEEAIGQTPALLHSGRQDAVFYQSMWQELERNKYWQGEIWNRRKDGEIYLEWLTVTGVANAEGALTHYVAVFSDITQRKQAEEKIHFLAYHDKLTGLPNRTLFYDRLSRAMSQARRKNSRFALLFLDLDGFKAVNDDYGHEAGDKVLRESAERLLTCVREIDTVARLGGDEFAIILDEIEQSQDITGVAEKVIQKLSAAVILSGQCKCKVGVSIGMAIYPDDAAEIDSLMSAADAAMYVSKAAGKGRCTFARKQIFDKADAQPWIEFNDAYLLGVPAMDDQHQVLVELLNKLNDLLKNNASVAMLNQIFDELTAAVGAHFVSEEALMDEAAYDYAAHKQEHQRLLAEIAELKKKFFSGGEFMVLQSLKGWLINHVLQSDKAFANFFLQKDAKETLIYSCVPA